MKLILCKLLSAKRKLLPISLRATSVTSSVDSIYRHVGSKNSLKVVHQIHESWETLAILVSSFNLLKSIPSALWILIYDPDPPELLFWQLFVWKFKREWTQRQMVLLCWLYSERHITIWKGEKLEVKIWGKRCCCCLAICIFYLINLFCQHLPVVKPAMLRAWDKEKTQITFHVESVSCFSCKEKVGQSFQLLLRFRTFSKVNEEKFDTLKASSVFLQLLNSPKLIYF